MNIQVKSPNGVWCTAYKGVTKDFANAFIKQMQNDGFECRAI